MASAPPPQFRENWKTEKRETLFSFVKKEGGKEAIVGESNPMHGCPTYWFAFYQNGHYVAGRCGFPSAQEARIAAEAYL